MRQPQSRCKTCQVAYNRKNREPRRRYDRKRYWRVRNDPAAWADQLEAQRFSYRRRRGVTHVSRRRGGPDLVDPVPFATWLRTVIIRDGSTANETSLRLGLGEKTVRELLNGRRQGVELATVERALIADDTITLRELYPNLYEEAA